MASIRGRVNSLASFYKWAEELIDFWRKYKYIQVTASDKRSLDANAAIRVAYKQIQEHKEGWTAKDVERHCKLKYGVPIIRKDDVVQDYVLNRALSGATYEQQLKIMDAFAVTSIMSTTQANEMIECMMQDFPFIVIEKKVTE